MQDIYAEFMEKLHALHDAEKTLVNAKVMLRLAEWSFEECNKRMLAHARQEIDDETG